MYVVKKKTLITIAVCLGMFLVFGVTLACAFAPTGNDSRLCVVIDAGHGGIDAGAVGRYTGTKESELNLTISKMIAARFDAANVRVVMTRATSDGLYGVPTNGFKRRDMQKRKSIIEEAMPNVVLSVHMNMTELESCSGAQVFYSSKGSETGKNLADSIQKSLNEKVGFKRPRIAAAGDFYMLNCTEYTSVLVECGFISNRQEEKLLQEKDYQEKIAQYIYEGVMNYLTIEF